MATIWLKCIAAAATILCGGSWAGGVWVKAPDDIALASAARGYIPDYAIVKLATFDAVGNFRLVHTYSSIIDACGRAQGTQGWISYRKDQPGPLTSQSGKTLGTKMNEDLIGACYTPLHLEIEPLTGQETWLPTYLKALRDTLNPDRELLLVVPPVTTKKLTGLSWTPESAGKALELIDGLSIMLYDTGIASPQDYRDLIKETFTLLNSLKKKFPQKKFVVNLPAYINGKAGLHTLMAENLREVKRALSELEPEHAKVLCGSTVRLAHFAHWEMSGLDKTSATQIRQWRIELCKEKGK